MRIFFEGVVVHKKGFGLLLGLGRPFVLGFGVMISSFFFFLEKDKGVIDGNFEGTVCMEGTTST